MATNTYDTNNAGYPSRTSRTHGFARAVRNILGALWLACSAVVLGIGAYFIKNNRAAGVSSWQVRLAVAVAALTILYELIWIPGRLILRGVLVALATEAVITFIHWILWLVAAIAYTIHTSDVRDSCDDNMITGMGSCRLIKTLLAFIWICFAISTIIFLYTVYVAVTRSRSRSRAYGSSWSESFADHSEVKGNTNDNMVGATHAPRATMSRRSEETYVDNGAPRSGLTGPKTTVAV